MRSVALPLIVGAGLILYADNIRFLRSVRGNPGTTVHYIPMSRIKL